MNLRDFLSHPDINLPISFGSSIDPDGSLRKRFDTFLELIAQLDSGGVSDRVQARKTAIQCCCDEIVASLRASLEGHPHDAYDHFDSALQCVKTEIEQYASIDLSPRELHIAYRVRRSKAPSLSREDLFHIPFEERHKVATQRYSIPGLPCLYLSGSLYTCWEEMGRPPFHELHVAAFWAKQGASLKVLNFSNRPKGF